MSLNWSLKEIENSDEICWVETDEGERLNGVTECLIWAAMFVDIGRITKRNAQRFHERVHSWETVHGPINSNGQHISFNDVVRHIGLATNVSNTTDAQFRKKLHRALAEKAKEERSNDA